MKAFPEIPIEGKGFVPDLLTYSLVLIQCSSILCDLFWRASRDLKFHTFIKMGNLRTGSSKGCTAFND